MTLFKVSRIKYGFIEFDIHPHQIQFQIGLKVVHNPENYWHKCSQVTSLEI